MTNYKENEEKIADLYAEAKMYRDQIDRLVAKYGDGIRPSWVSSDISGAMVYESWLLKEAAKLEREG